MNKGKNILSIAYLNIQGVKTKELELKTILQEEKLDLLCLNETFLTDKNNYKPKLTI